VFVELVDIEGARRMIPLAKIDRVEDLGARGVAIWTEGNGLIFCADYAETMDRIRKAWARDLQAREIVREKLGEKNNA